MPLLPHICRKDCPYEKAIPADSLKQLSPRFVQQIFESDGDEKAYWAASAQRNIRSPKGVISVVTRDDYPEKILEHLLMICDLHFAYELEQIYSRLVSRNDISWRLFQVIFLRVLRKVYDLPASERHHDSEPFGLL